MKLKRFRRLSVSALATFVVAGLLWAFSPVQAVTAVWSLSDPARLATLGKRGANPRLNRILYWLDDARRKGLDPTTAVDLVLTFQGVKGARAELTRDALLRNLRIADQLGLLTPDNRVRLERGAAAVVTVGPYRGEAAEVDHLVPVSLAPELDTVLANLEMLPESLNRRKSNRVGERQWSLAEAFFEAGLLTEESLDRVRARRQGPPSRRR
ncbi:MAG: hypothetical protein ACYDC1_16400 [Limisphaerales bacterium]